MQILLGYVLTILYISCLVLGCQFFQQKGKGVLYQEICRKLVHILIFAVYFIFKHTFGFTYHAVIICLILVPIAICVERLGIIGDNINDTVTYGITLYAISMTFLCIVCCFVDGFAIPFGIAVMCTCFGDGLASVVGISAKCKNPIILWHKTILGSVTCFFASFLVVFLFSKIYNIALSFSAILIIASFSFLSELASPKRTDNITLPLVTAFISYGILANLISISNCILLLIIILAVITVVSKRILTPTATLAAVLIGFTIYSLGGLYLFLTLASFFVIAIITDNIKRAKKSSVVRDIHHKNHCRDLYQVLANGLIPTICIFIHSVTHNHIFIIAFFSVLAAMTADTSASEIGMLSKKNPVCILTRKTTSTGLSGGVTILGCVAGFFGSLIISVEYLFQYKSLYSFCIIMVVGIIGMLFDSVIGDCLQVKYRCTKCGIITEKPMHCDSCTTQYSGLAIINNDSVNLINSLFVAVLSVAFYIFIN